MYYVVTSPQSLRTRTPGCYTGTLSQHVGIYIPEAGLGTHRNINSASGVVLAPEVQPGPPQICTVNGTSCYCPFCHPCRSQLPILQLGTLEQWE